MYYWYKHVMIICVMLEIPHAYVLDRERGLVLEVQLEGGYILY